MASRVDLLGKIKRFDRTPQGGIVAPSFLTRVGVFTYWQVDASGKTVPFRELRHPDEVFNKDSLASLAGAPVTLDHPSEPVTPENWKDLAIGHVSDSVKAEGRYVAAEVRVQDASAVKAVEAGELVEFSCGYDCDVLAAEPGATYDGLPYDGVQKNIRYNHVGMGPKNWGRAGNEVRLRVDGKNSCARMDRMPDSYDLPMTEEQLAALKADHQKALDALQGTADAEKARADAATEALASEKSRADSVTAELATEKARADAAMKAHTDAAAASSPEAIDARVNVRVALVEGARLVAPEIKTDGLSDRDVRVSALLSLDPNFKADGRSDDYVTARFEVVCENASKATAGQDKLRKDAEAAQGSDTRAVSKIDKSMAEAAEAKPWLVQNVKRS